MTPSIENRTTALSALYQCLDGVNQLAYHGNVDEHIMHTAMQSVLGEDQDSIAEVYGGLENLNHGFMVLQSQLGSSGFDEDSQKKLDTTRYAINLLALQKALFNTPQAFERLIADIESVQTKLDTYPLMHENTIANTARIYQQHISNLGNRVMVKGDQVHLGNEHVANQIRALLLAGVRATLLWNDAGGSRWKLLMERRKMQKQAAEYIRRNKSSLN